MLLPTLLAALLGPQAAESATYRLTAKAGSMAYFSGSVWSEQGTGKRAGLASVYKAGTQKYGAIPVAYAVLDVEVECASWTAKILSNTRYSESNQPLSTTVSPTAGLKPITSGTAVAFHAQAVCGRATPAGAPVSRSGLIQAGRAALDG